MQLGRAEVLRGLRNFLNMDRSKDHSINRLKERGVEKGSGRHSTLRGRGTICVQPDKHGQCFEDNFGETAERRGGGRMGLS